MSEDGGQVSGVRRRGAKLEASLLEAAWLELSAVGYPQLTMEGVAARAKTSKQVLYRRWRNRAELVIAAIQYRRGSISDDLPDVGEFRGDVLAVLRLIVQRQREVGSDVVHGLMADVPNLDPQLFATVNDVMSRLFRRAIARGELAPVKLSLTVMTLPIGLLLYETMFANQPMQDEALIEIVDEAFLPLLRAHGAYVEPQTRKFD